MGVFLKKKLEGEDGQGKDVVNEVHVTQIF